MSVVYKCDGSPRMRRPLFVAVLLLVGCAGTDSATKPEFTLRLAPSQRDDATENTEMYVVEGHGRTCYVAAFGSSKVLLWCESSKP
jgi:hypothetical protein